MYGWIWRKLPGHFFSKLLCALLLTVSVVALLLFVVFPIVGPHLPFSHVTVDTPPSPSPTG